jgi:hypothetical protein
MRNSVEIVAAAAFRLDYFIVAGVFQAAVTISYGHIPLSHIRTFILNSNILRADEVSGLCECDHNKTHGLRQQRFQIEFPSRSPGDISPWVVHNVPVSAKPRNRDLSAILQRGATRAGFGVLQRRCYAAPITFSAGHFPPLPLQQKLMHSHHLSGNQTTTLYHYDLRTVRMPV